MTTKLYLHDAASSDTGTLPSAAIFATPQVTATGASTNRSMDTTAGTVQVAPTLATSAVITAQNGWLRRFLSAPLAAQTLGSTTVAWMLQSGIKTSNATASAWKPWSSAITNLGVWRPSTGALVASLGGTANGTPNSATVSEGLAGPAGGYSIGTSSTFACSAGDILVLESWGRVTQTTATSYTWTFYYDGTTDDSITSCAAYLISPTTLTFLTASPGPPILQARQAVNRASTF